MQALLDIAPVVAFFVTYKVAGIYTATAVLMAGMAIVLAVDFARTRRVSAMHAASAVLVFAFGAATLILHDQRFIQWKPTVFFWLVSIALLGSTWIGEQPLVQRLLGHLLEAGTQVSAVVWRRLNLVSVVFYALLGAVNLVVAYNASERVWVNFKVFGLTSVTVVFLAAQVAWLARQPVEASPAQASDA
jgi:intracellular septation protein